MSVNMLKDLWNRVLNSPTSASANKTGSLAQQMAYVAGHTDLLAHAITPGGPSSYDSAQTISSGNTVDAFGNWVTLYSNVSGKLVLLSVRFGYQPTQPDRCEIQFGFGTTPQLSVALLYSNEWMLTVPVYLEIPSSTNLQARVRDNLNTAISYRIIAYVVP